VFEVGVADAGGLDGLACTPALLQPAHEIKMTDKIPNGRSILNNPPRGS